MFIDLMCNEDLIQCIYQSQKPDYAFRRQLQTLTGIMTQC